MKNDQIDEFGDYADNRAALERAMMLLDAGAFREGHASLARLRSHIELTGEIKSQRWLLPVINREIARGLAGVGGKSVARPGCSKRNTNSVYVHRSHQESHQEIHRGWEGRILSWALGVIFVIEILAVIIFVIISKVNDIKHWFGP